MASITASIQDQNFLQAWMMTSLSRSVITSEVMTLREARVIWGHLLTSLSTSHYMKYLKGYNLLSYEATFPSTSGPSGWPSARPGCAWQWGHPHGQNQGGYEGAAVLQKSFSHRNKGSSVYKVSAVMLQLLGKIFRLSSLYCHRDTFPDRIYQCKKKVDIIAKRQKY